MTGSVAPADHDAGVNRGGSEGQGEIDGDLFARGEFRGRGETYPTKTEIDT